MTEKEIKYVLERALGSLLAYRDRQKFNEIDKLNIHRIQELLEKLNAK